MGTIALRKCIIPVQQSVTEIFSLPAPDEYMELAESLGIKSTKQRPKSSDNFLRTVPFYEKIRQHELQAKYIN
jgi:hypothetical protein